MCNIDRKAEAQLLALGLNLITKVIDASIEPQPSTDVLTTATKAYQQGKITKAQFMAVINALDEQTYSMKAYAVPSQNKLALY
jgi:hypothetical protein